MAWTRASTIVALLTLMPALALSAAMAESDASTAPAGAEALGGTPEEIHQDEAAAAAHDAALMAEQTGLPVEDAEGALAFQNAFALYGIEDLLPRYEDQISAIWVDPAPAARGYVQFVAEVPEQAIDEATRRGLAIVFLGGGEISMAEHDLRSDLAVDALIAAGYQNFMAYPDRQHAVIRIELKLPESEPAPDAADLLDLVRSRIEAYRPTPGGLPLEGRAAEVRASDLELTVIRGDGPIAYPGGPPKQPAPAGEDSGGATRLR